MQVDATSHPIRVQLNAGIAQGIESGSVFAIYPRQIKDLTQETKHLALAEVIEVGVTDAWAKIIKVLLPEEIESGAKAVIIGAPVDLIRGIRLVECTKENTKLEDLPPKEINQQAALQAIAMEILRPPEAMLTKGAAQRNSARKRRPITFLLCGTWNRTR